MDGDGVGLLGDSGMGKSTLSSAIHQRGCLILTDDLIPLVWEKEQTIIHPGIPMSRIWPDTGNQFVDEFDRAERIHPEGQKRKVFDRPDKARFAQDPAPLKTLYILERGHDLELIPTSPAESLMALVRYSYRPEPVHALGLQPARMKTLGRTAASTRVLRLRYPSGFDQLENVIDRILED